jgi:release factor glutamine methyltransferase
VATDVDERAVACARSNGVEALQGDLFDGLHVKADVVTGVVPYVPTPDLPLLQRDTFTFETTLSYDGGPDGMAILQRAADDALRYLKPGGALLLELGGDQAEALDLDDYVGVETILDEEGDVRGVCCQAPRLRGVTGRA